MFAQESVMEIEKLKAEFEKLKYINEKLEYLNFDEHLGCYVEKNNGMPVGLAAWVNGAFYGFKQAAKAQAVPDVQQALNDRLLVRSIKEQVESHIAEISVNDLFDKGWFAAMKCIQSNIDMLEAGEPTND